MVPFFTFQTLCIVFTGKFYGTIYYKQIKNDKKNFQIFTDKKIKYTYYYKYT